MSPHAVSANPVRHRSLFRELFNVPRSLWATFLLQFHLPRWGWASLLGIVALGFLLRVEGIARHPMHKFESLYQDESKIIANTGRLMTGTNLAPHYPIALYRWLLPQMEIAKIVTFLDEPPPPGRWRQRTEDFLVEVRGNPLPYYLLIRANMVLFSMAHLLLLFAVARHIAADRAAPLEAARGGTATNVPILVGLVVAAFAAIFPLFVLYCKMAYYDLPMTFWFTVTTAVLAWTWHKRSIGGLYWSSALTAWAFCCKQNAATLIPLTGLTLIVVSAAHARRPWYLAFLSGHFYGSVLLGGLVLLWGYPSLLDPEALRTFLSRVQGTYYEGGVDTFTKVPNWRGWLTIHWPQQGHLSVFFALVAGLVFVVRYRHTSPLAWFFALSTLLYYLVAGQTSHSIDRTMLPLISGLCLGAGGWILWYRALAPRKWGLLAAASILALSFISLLHNSLRYNLLVTAKDTREQALSWLEKNAQTGSRILQEHYTSYLRTTSPGHYTLKRSLKDRTRPRLFLSTTTDVVGAKEAEDYERRKLDYILLSSTIEQNARDLEGGKRLKTVAHKRGRYTKRIDDTFTNRARVRQAFPAVATFQPRSPDSSLLLRGIHTTDDGHDNTPQKGYLFNPALIDLWWNHDEFILGPTIEILRSRK